MKLLVVEARSRGLQHAAFNAALLNALHVACPNANVHLIAAPEHHRFLREALVYHTPGAHGWLTAEDLLPPRISSNNRAVHLWVRARHQMRLGKLAREHGADAVLVTGPSRPDVALLELLMTRGLDAPLAALLHEPRYLLDPAGTGRFSWRWLDKTFGGSTRFIVLAPSLAAEVLRRAPRLRGRLDAIHFPLLPLPPNLATASPREPRGAGGPVTFGLLGGDWRKSTRAMFSVVQAVASQGTKARFSLVGHVRRTDEVPAGISGLIEGFSRLPISHSDYFERAAALDWVVWVGDPDEYDLSASGSLVDAINLGKPIVASRTRLSAGYFEEFGNLGFLCDDTSAIVERVTSLANDLVPDETWAEIRTALRRARERFAPEVIGTALLGALVGAHE